MDYTAFPTTQHYIPQDLNHIKHYCENLTSHVVYFIWKLLSDT